MADLFDNDEAEDDEPERPSPEPLGALGWIGRIREDSRLSRRQPRP